MEPCFLPVFAAATPDIVRWAFAAIGVVLLFGISIIVHEGGHFAAAKLLGLKADVFSVGFGPALWKKRIGETEYRLSVLPFGGYVALPQLDPVGMARIQGGDSPSHSDPSAVQQAVWWKRLIVAVAGPLCNILLAIPLALLVWALPPVESPAVSFGGAVIGEVAQASAAAEAGVKPGDFVLAVADKKIASWADFIQEVHLCNEDGAVSLSLSNILSGEIRQASVPVEKDNIGTWRIVGIEQAEVCGIGETVAESAAALDAGLAVGDALIAVNGRRGFSPESFAGLLDAAARSDGGTATLTVQHDGSLVEKNVAVRFDADWTSSPEGRAFTPGAIVLELQAGMPAANSGLQPGDRIISIGGAAVSSAEEAVSAINQAGETPFKIMVERRLDDGSSERLELETKPVLHDPGDDKGERPLIGASLGGISPTTLSKIEPLLAFGIIPASVQPYVPPWSRHHAPLDQLKGDAASIWRIFGPLFGHRHKGELGRIATSLGGPVIILSSLWSWLLASFAAAMGFMRFLNVNLAIVNLLPIPVLDGGHVVFALWRGATGHELPPKVVNALVNIFGVVIIVLFVLLSGCDAFRLYARFSS